MGLPKENSLSVIILDLLIFTLSIPVLGLPFTLFWIYKQLVTIVAKAIHPDLIPVSDNDSLVSLDRFAPVPGQKGLPLLRQNLGWLMRVPTAGTSGISLEWIRQKFVESFFRVLPNGTREYPNFFAYPVRFGGYSFRKPVENLDVTKHVYQYKLKVGESLEAYASRFISQAFPPNSPVWELVLVSNTGRAGENALLFKINHACADGYSLIHIIDALTDHQTPYVAESSNESFLDKVKFLIQFPRVFASSMRTITKNTNPYPFKLSKDTALDPGTLAFLSTDLATMQLLRRKSRTHFISLLASIQAGVIQRICTESKSQTVACPDVMQIFVPLPWPNHPSTQLCNHWTLGNLTVPLGSETVLTRLRAIEKDLVDYYDKGLDKMTNRFLFKFYGVLPSEVQRTLFESNLGMQTAFTALMGSREEYRLSGRPIAGIHFLIGTTFEHYAMLGCGFSHGDKFNCVFSCKKEVIDAAKGPGKIKEYFLKEVEELKEHLLHEERG